MRLMKYRKKDGLAEWGMVDNEKIIPLKNVRSAGEVFAAINGKRLPAGRAIARDTVLPVAPTDARVQVCCAGLNYRDHAEEVRMPLPKNPIFFTKSAAALCGAFDAVRYPDTVTLLDYEIELGLVVGRTIGEGDIITPGNLGEYILGITIFNDVSARDYQMRAGQWFLGKTFRTFAPMGPYIQTIDGGVLSQLYSLNLELQVHDPHGAPYPDKRQRGVTANMIFPVHELLNCLREKFDLLPGDVIATGTPCGVAMGRPTRLRTRIEEILGVLPAKRTEKFLRGEISGNKKYLRRGDVITARIFSNDGVVDLGKQKNTIV